MSMNCSFLCISWREKILSTILIHKIILGMWITFGKYFVFIDNSLLPMDNFLYKIEVL